MYDCRFLRSRIATLGDDYLVTFTPQKCLHDECAPRPIVQSPFTRRALAQELPAKATPRNEGAL